MGHAGPYHITRALRSRVNQELQEASFVITRGLNDLWLLQEDGLTCLNSFTGWQENKTHYVEEQWSIAGPADRGISFMGNISHLVDVISANNRRTYS